MAATFPTNKPSALTQLKAELQRLQQRPSKADLQPAEVSFGKIPGYAARRLGQVRADTTNEQRGGTNNEQQSDDQLPHGLTRTEKAHYQAFLYSAVSLCLGLMGTTPST